MDRAKHQLDEYTTKSADSSNYLAFDLIDSKSHCLADEILGQGEQLFESVERQKGYPSLNGLDSQYKQVRLWYESPSNFEKKIGMIAKVLGPGQNEPSSTDVTTVSGSFLPPFSLNEFMAEEDSHQKTNQNRDVEESALNLSNISFDDPNSPINQTTNTDKASHLSKFAKSSTQYQINETINSSESNESKPPAQSS